jgi:hypothetical protein
MKYDCVHTLENAGFSYEDATALRRISMTLHRWHKLECGTAAGCIEREDETAVPYLTWDWPGNKGPRGRTKIADRERGALKRLAAIMVRYPGFESYVQGDPRGAALYILRPGDIPEGATLDSCYNRGIVVCK